MQQTWVCCATRLPREGAPIRFTLDDRMTSILGRYAGGVFVSRWASYDRARVEEWCALDINPDTMPVAVVRTANNQRSVTLLKQLNTLFARSSAAVTDGSFTTVRNQSNQMSS